MPLRRPTCTIALALAATLTLACSDSTGPSRPVVASIEASGPSDTVGLADTVRMGAVARDAGGTAIAAAAVSWRSLHPRVATIDSAGLVTGIAAGNASIVASAGGRTGVADTVVVRVRALPRTISITGLADSVRAVYEDAWPGSARDTALATVKDGRGTAIAVPVRWSSSDTVIATVGTTGIVTVNNPGTAWIRADAGRGVVDSVRVRGTARRVTGPAFASFRIAQWTLASPPELGTLSCGLSTTGEAWCGSGATFATQLVPGGQRFGALALGNRSACGLVAADSTLACWGSNDVAQLGIGTTTPASVTTPVIAAAGRKFRAFAVGHGNTVCGIAAADSLVYCWGNSGGAIADAPPYTADSTAAPVPGLPKALAVAVSGTTHACAIVVDGSVWCWGDAGFYGNVSGVPAARYRAPYQVAPAAGYVSIVPSDFGACMLDGAGAVRCLMSARQSVGTILRMLPAAAVPGGAMTRLVGARGGDACGVSVTGALTCVQLAVTDDAVRTLVARLWLPGRRVIDASSTLYTLCATTDDNVVQCW